MKGKLQLDFDNKIINVENLINLGDFFECLNLIFPNNTWKEFKLEINTIINWSNPIIIESPYPIYPIWPWYNQPYIITYGTSGTNKTNEVNSYSSNNYSSCKLAITGTYNIEVK